MEAMRTANAEKRDSVSTLVEYFERKARIVCEQHFVSPNRFLNSVVKVLLRCVICFPFFSVGTHFRIFVCQFLIHSRTMYASPQKLARPPFYSFCFDNRQRYVKHLFTSHSYEALFKKHKKPSNPRKVCSCYFFVLNFQRKWIMRRNCSRQTRSW